MKRFTLKSVLFALFFAVSTGLLCVNVLADDTIKPVERIGWYMPDSSGDTTDGGIWNPGLGH